MLNVNFIYYVIAEVVITLASSMLSVAVGWHIYQATGNPFDLALVGLMQILPIIGLFIPAGWVVDNFSRKRILVVCTLLQGAVYLGLAFTLEGESIDRAATFGLLLLNGVARVFFSPAMRQSCVGSEPAALTPVADAAFSYRTICSETRRRWRPVCTGPPTGSRASAALSYRESRTGRTRTAL